MPISPEIVFLTERSDFLPLEPEHQVLTVQERDSLEHLIVSCFDCPGHSPVSMEVLQVKLENVWRIAWQSEENTRFVLETVFGTFWLPDFIDSDDISLEKASWANEASRLFQEGRFEESDRVIDQKGHDSRRAEIVLGFDPHLSLMSQMAVDSQDYRFKGLMAMAMARKIIQSGSVPCQHKLGVVQTMRRMYESFNNPQDLSEEARCSILNHNFLTFVADCFTDSRLRTTQGFPKDELYSWVEEHGGINRYEWKRIQTSLEVT